jgi:hypothetical protein
MADPGGRDRSKTLEEYGARKRKRRSANFAATNPWLDRYTLSDRVEVRFGLRWIECTVVGIHEKAYELSVLRIDGDTATVRDPETIRKA